jgi:bifunctional UDP-N-acetylglucosamine pyrophosphorylase / glucosamine-1-phosphate N-acetyltransferase
MTEIAVVVLAAGMGTRMKSALPKVLHKVAGRSLLGHALHAAKRLNPRKVVVVLGPEAAHEATRKEAAAILNDVAFAVRGTGHAVGMAEAALEGFKGTVLVLYGDVPLVQTDALQGLLAKLSAKTPMAVLGFEAANPFGYGRLLLAGKTVKAIREERDASAKERKVTLCNSGIIAIHAQTLWPMLKKLKPANAQGELYLTDVVGLVVKAGKSVALSTCEEADVQGVNDRVQLAAISAELQNRLRHKAMLEGATLIAPETVFLSADTELGRDVVIEPNVVFGPGVKVGDGAEILASSHIEGATVGKGARIGPFARLRPGADIGENGHVGNFVEIKKATVGKGAKVNHLTYIGDAHIGAASNIGAGTITCNYDGYEKHVTEIGENVFVGSNTALVAPVRIGRGANIAAGSVITADVPEDALAMTRAPATVKEGWAKRYRAMKLAKKNAKSKS